MSTPNDPGLMLDGALYIVRERLRQVVGEGYQPEHDAMHRGNELAWASWCYLDRAASNNFSPTPPQMWPWADDAWKPGPTRLRMLVKAGALIAAEVDRILADERREALQRGNR